MGVITGGTLMPGYGPFVYAGTPVDGTTLAGVAYKGAVLIDETNGVLYINTGTQASPAWSPAASVLDANVVAGSLGIYTNAGAPTDGTTLANVAPKGALLADTTNGVLYINTGTQASPVWTVVGTQA